MALEDFMWAMLFSAIVVLILIAVDYVDPQQVVANPSMQKVAVLVAVVAVSIVGKSL
jgi:tellurite resistance protein TehA-like permease